MPRRILLLASIAALTMLVGCQTLPPPGDEEVSDVILLPVEADPTVSFSLWFNVGSADDPAGKEGLAYLTGQMLVEGATTENSYEAILQQLFPIASSYQVRVDKEMTTLTGRTHRDNLDAYFQLFTDAYLNPAFDKDDFKRLKNNQLNALQKNLRYASDEELGKAALFKLLFAGTPYAHPTIGTVAGLEAITLEDVRAFYQKYYAAGNVTLALGGGYPADLVERFEKTLEALPQGEPAATPILDPAPLTKRKVLLVQKPDADASISLGFPIDVRRGERDFYALWIATSWLGEHRNSASHLYKVIREQRGMNYGDYAYIEAFPQGGMRQFPPPNVARQQQIFEIWIRTLPNDNALFALRAALRELQNLVDDGMSEEDFERTRSFVAKYALHYAQTTQDRLAYAIDDRFYGLDEPGHLQRMREVIPTLTREEVNAALAEHLRYENLGIAIVTGEAQALKKAMIEDQPSPPVYATPKDESILEEDKAIVGLPLGIESDGVEIIGVDEIFEN